jgi:hypothetical protein
LDSLAGSWSFFLRRNETLRIEIHERQAGR